MTYFRHSQDKRGRRDDTQSALEAVPQSELGPNNAGDNISSIDVPLRIPPESSSTFIGQREDGRGANADRHPKSPGRGATRSYEASVSRRPSASLDAAVLEPTEAPRVTQCHSVRQGKRGSEHECTRGSQPASFIHQSAVSQRPTVNGHHTQWKTPSLRSFEADAPLRKKTRVSSGEELAPFLDAESPIEPRSLSGVRSRPWPYSLGPVNISPEILEKIGRIGSVEVLKDLRHTISRCRAIVGPQSPIRTYDENEPPPGIHFSKTNDMCISLSPYSVRYLRKASEPIALGQQLCILRRRITWSDFYNKYFSYSPANPPLYRSSNDTAPGEERIRSLSTERPQPDRLPKNAKSFIVNELFPWLAPLGDGERKAAEIKLDDWKRRGKTLAKMVNQFGKGILLLLPSDLPDSK